MSGIITVLFGAMFASAFAKYQFSGEVNMFCASAPLFAPRRLASIVIARDRKAKL